ncbi:MAG: hypothetical protein Ct9H300mP16_01230 [Pseudomonadota bacterium]|nr:MAG: hypothetical protein Ct9H300mP16_01230 [Pseudomonadota bacterium]
MLRHQPGEILNRQRLRSRVRIDPRLRYDLRLTGSLQRLRSVLRRWENACRTSVLKGPCLALTDRAVRPGALRLTTAERTFGGGLNAPGPTSNNNRVSHTRLTITLSRLYPLEPGSATRRWATSFCSMKTIRLMKRRCDSNRISRTEAML